MVRGNGFTWEGAHTRLRMTLVDDRGQKSERVLDVIGRRKDGLLASKVEFLSPSDVAGTKFLTLEKASGGTEQHIYLPGLKRTRRISGGPCSRRATRIQPVPPPGRVQRQASCVPG